MNLPAQMTPENIAVFLQKQLGIRLTGDAELHLLAEMPFRLSDLVPLATVTTAATNGGTAPNDITKLTTALTKGKGGK